MAEFTLKKRMVRTLKVNIGEESFHIPHAQRGGTARHGKGDAGVLPQIHL